MDRARATVYRMHPMTAILALLASGLALWLPLDLGLALCIFAATAIAGYGIQAHDAGNNVAEGGVFAVLKALELVLVTIYARVSISVTKTNDRARALALDLLDKFATAMAKLPQGTLTPAEMRAYIDREILTIPVTESDIVQDDARAGTAAETDDAYGANALASEADDLLTSIIASLSEDEIQALSTETNQVAVTLRLTTHIEDLAATNTLLAAWLTQ